MKLADIHTHVLYGVDDGPQTKAEMQALLDAEYKEGVRLLCFTPHMHPALFGNNQTAVLKAYDEARDYVSLKFPDMKVCLGNEIHYGNNNSLQWLKDNHCMTYNDTRYVLIEFPDDISRNSAQEYCMRLLRSGYLPVIAHIERYRHLCTQYAMIEQLRSYGILIQIDGGALFQKRLSLERRKSNALLDHRLVDVVASDCHDLKSRPPILSKCFKYIQESYGTEYAEKIMWHIPLMITTNQKDLEV